MFILLHQTNKTMLRIYSSITLCIQKWEKIGAVLNYASAVLFFYLNKYKYTHLHIFLLIINIELGWTEKSQFGKCLTQALSTRLFTSRNSLTLISFRTLAPNCELVLGGKDTCETSGDVTFVVTSNCTILRVKRKHTMFKFRWTQIEKKKKRS